MSTSSARAASRIAAQAEMVFCRRLRNLLPECAVCEGHHFDQCPLRERFGSDSGPVALETAIKRQLAQEAGQ